MKNGMMLVLWLAIFFSSSPDLVAQGAQDPGDAQGLLDSLITVEAPIFSPKAYEKARSQYELARQAKSQNRSASSVAGYYERAREFAENALRNTDVCKLSLKEYLPPREKAKAAKAPVLVPALYQKAEAQFIVAAAKVESGDVKGGLKEADRSTPLFDLAEIEAIRVDVLGKADALIATAVADEATKFALTMLDKARTAREKANDMITADRYDRAGAASEATRAEYEARHASTIAQSVRSLNRNDQAWEKLMLLYEIQMDRAAQLLDVAYLPFDQGPSRAADSLIAAIKLLQAAATTSAGKYEDSIKNLEKMATNLSTEQAQLRSELAATLKTLGGDDSLRDPFVITRSIDSSIAAILAERASLSEQVSAEQGKLSRLSEEHQEVSTELQARQAREERLNSAKTMIDPTQGELLVTASNDIVLRLFALTFDAGKSEIVDQHLPLLDKVKQIIGLFPESPLVIEGHTDDRGDPKGNTQLSEKRAFAVMQYLRQTLNIPSDRIRAIGYGSEKPIASQSTAEGRAKNRRIDIVIMQ